MSDKETNLKELDSQLSQEDNDIVDSIISELNTDEKKNNEESNAAKQKMMQERMMQEQMMQEQMMQEQMMQEQMMKQKIMQEQMALDKRDDKKEEKEEKEDKSNKSIIDKLKVDIKIPAIVSMIILILLMPQSNALINMIKIEILSNPDGTISTYGLLLKAIIGGLLFYGLSKYL